MDFRKVLTEALKICGEHADDPFLLYSALCDCARNDYTVSPQMEMFHRFNKIYGLVAEMKKTPEPRMIGTLLERCREQPDVPKSCLKWIHTIFEFYYRAKHGERKDTEQILESLEADLFEPELEGLDLPKPKQKKAGVKRTPKVNTPNPAPAKVATPPTPAPQNPLPTQFQPVNPPLPPGAVYRNLPYNANVYLAEGSRIIHVSSECPCIRPALNQTLYKATYHRARYKDFYNINHLTKNTTTYERLSLNHTPPVCAKCGDFTPILFGKPPKIQYKQL
jgi:hypothetical protein